MDCLPESGQGMLSSLSEGDFIALQKEWDSMPQSRKHALLWDIEHRAVYRELSIGYGISFRLAVLVTNLARRRLLTPASLKKPLHRK